MKAFITFLPALLLATASAAQTPMSSASLLPSADPMRSIENFTRVNEAFPLQAAHDTPTMQRQRLIRALALRAEAIDLLDRGGGTLSEEQQRYFRREARKIAPNAL